MNDTKPKIIFTNKPSTNNFNQSRIISLSCREFINFIKSEGIKSVFSAYSPSKNDREYYMFAIKDGFILKASYQDIDYMNSYYQIKSIGCEDFFEFLEINLYPIIIDYKEEFKRIYFKRTRAEIYQRFKASKFFGYSLTDFETYKDALIRGFKDNQEYRNANSLHIETKKEYDNFKDSGYKRYQDYLDGIKGGFDDKTLFYKAKALDIPTYKKFKEFLEKGFKDMLDKVVEIESDAEKAYQNRQYEQIIQLRYLAAEKLSEIVYYKLFNKKISIENNLNTSEIVKSIEEKLNIKLNALDELNKWRIKRNEIVHDHIKVEQGTADLANQFFAEFMPKLRSEFQKLLLI